LDINNNKIDTDILVIPGVGAFPKAINFLKKNKLDKKIKEFNDKNKVIFGICLGMQLLFDSSSEFGDHKGLSLISGTVEKIDKKLINVPNIGWFPITHTNKNFFLPNQLNNEFFYFVHSYYCNPKNQKNIIATTKISKFNFCSAVQKEKIIGTQFHPEKSGDKGMQILRNLYKWV
jgi:glutamine amidotransferase